MKVLRIIGVLLIVGGLAGLAVGKFSFTRSEPVVEVGPLKLSAEKEHSLNVPPVAGAVALGLGVAVLVVGFRKR
ncbi:MAG: DUF3185 domain-containing protein [Gammaproteobacteria bacterium]|jgi:hypothetical protein